MTKIFYLKLSLLFFLPGFFFFIGDCKLEKINKTDCQSVRIIYDAPLILNNGSIFDFVSDSFDISYLSGFTVYKFYRLVAQDANTDSSYDIIIPEYFMFKDGHQRGTYLNYKNNYNNYSVDSLLRPIAFYKIDDVFKSFPDSLIEIQQTGAGDKLIRQFILKSKPDIDNPDTVKFYFSDKFKNFKFSLSPSLEKISGLKLIRYSMIFNSRWYKGYDFKFPRREVFIEMRAIENDESCYVASRNLDLVRDKMK